MVSMVSDREGLRPVSGQLSTAQHPPSPILPVRFAPDCLSPVGHPYDESRSAEAWRVASELVSARSGVPCVADLVKMYKFEHQPTETAMQGRNLRYVSARASFRAGKSKNGNYRLRQNHR